jgi:hypothetical protein
MQRWPLAVLLALGGCDDALSAVTNEAGAEHPAEAEETSTDRGASLAEAGRAVTSMVDATNAYFNEERVEEGGSLLSADGSLAARKPSHNCPNDGEAQGSAGPTPPLSLDCSKGCTPTSSPSDDTDYDANVWDEAVWSALGVRPEAGHHTHYAFEWTNATSGFGKCEFKVTVTTDLDGERLATEIAGTLDENGLQAGKAKTRDAR